ncbi:MAG: HAD hydrolase-like protein, partial [Candidatus Saccharimonadales bacterium]
IHHLTKSEQLADVNNAYELRNNHTSLREAIRMLDLPRWRGAWLLKRGRKMMAKDIHDIPLIDGMDEALAKLHAAKFEMFIVTSNSKRNVERFLSIRGVLGDFKAVYGGAGMFSKQRLIRKALKQNRLAPGSVVYVGDEVRDIESAKAINMPIIAVTWGFNTEQLLLQYQPTLIARTPKQLADAIIGWGDSD